MSEIAKIQRQDVAPAERAVVTPMDMLNQAIEQGTSIEMMERLLTLHERWEASQAKKAFYEAKAAFKAENIVVTKDKDNKQYGSKYASIGNVVNTVNAVLAKHGLDASWEIVQIEKIITVTCILTHRGGHSERAQMSSTPDVSGQKNPIQQIKSTITYLREATYEAVTGIATSDSGDDDGNAAGTALITDEQQNELLALADEIGVDKVKFCGFFGIDSFAAIHAKDFNKAKSALEAKRKKVIQ